MAKDLEKTTVELRGGAWFTLFQTNLRAANRGWSVPSFMDSYDSFRCCKPVFCKKQVKRWKEETEGGLFDG